MNRRMIHQSAKLEDVMRKNNATANALGGSLLLALLMLGSVQAAETPGAGSAAFAGTNDYQFRRVGDGHPDPCWSLRVQRHRNSYSWWRFEDCIAHYNYNN